MTMSASANRLTPRDRRQVANQGAMLFAGYATAQGLSFVRNAIIGHALSKGEFGIAATITLILQVIETVTDFGSDRLIVQAKDGASRAMLAASHTMLLARGFLIALFLMATGPCVAAFFAVPQAAAAFQLAGLAALIKGFMHLDWRRAQRKFDNRPHLAVEVVPQAVALAAAIPMVLFFGDHRAVVWLAVVQSVTATALSHLLARTRYRLSSDDALFKRQLAFGWPILASALPLIAVYHADRIAIARFIGIEPLASYTVAFMITMVPGLIAAKVGHALMLPLFSEAHRVSGRVRRPFAPMAEATILAAALYLATFAIAGGEIVQVVFGPQYADLDVTVAFLAAMWAVRMIQAVPGMALMAYGTTRPFLIAGVIRAGALPFVLVAATHGAPLETIAALGCAFEVLSLVYVVVRSERLEAGLGWMLLLRVSFLVPTALVSLILEQLTAHSSGMKALAVAVIATMIGLCGTALMPSLRAFVRERLAKAYAGAALL